MSTSEKVVVDRMYAAFAKQDLQAALATITDDSIWIHHGSQRLPSLRFEGRSGVEKFFHTNFSTIQMEYFRVLKTIQDGNIVTVFGEEKFTMPGQDSPSAQKWVQVYTIKDGLIASMEEYATSAADTDYQVIK